MDEVFHERGVSDLLLISHDDIMNKGSTVVALDASTSLSLAPHLLCWFLLHPQAADGEKAENVMHTGETFLPMVPCFWAILNA